MNFIIEFYGQSISIFYLRIGLVFFFSEFNVIQFIGRAKMLRSHKTLDTLDL